jgi:succinate-semialdehyde dehydrogenase / glutarate-semialdehyde dehydrogenase
MSNLIQTSINPYNRQNVFQTENYDEETIDQIINQARKSFKYWSKLSIENRLKELSGFKNLLEKNLNDLAETITLEIGCPISQTKSEVAKAISIFDYYEKNAEKYLQDQLVNEDDKVKNYIKYEPLGLHFHVSPYNYPLYLALRPVIPALIAGNAVIIKTPSNTPLLATKLIEIIKNSGLTEGVLSIVLMSGTEVNRIVEDDRVDIVSIIGSEKAGQSVASLAGKNIKKSILELGGSDPFIVFEDSDLEKAVEGAIFSRTRNAGQSCNAAKRFIVQNSIKDKFISKLQEKFNDFVYGNPLDEDVNYSPMATESGLHNALYQIAKSVSKGANLITGGEQMPECGYMLAPTILDNVSEDMDVFFEETFAPIFAITGFETTEQAIKIANDSKYGLGASVWTNNLGVVNELVNNLEVGNVFVNSIVRGNINMPYGGIKKSGYGRELGEFGIKEFVNIKTVSIAKNV